MVPPIHRRRRRALQFEPLEERSLLSVLISENFNQPGPFQLNGSAQVANGQLSLTNDQWQAGSLWFNRLLTTDSFTAKFDFQLSQPRGIGWGDGFTFAVLDASKNDNHSLGEAGGSLAYKDLSGFAIEFDTYSNYEFNDPVYAHVGLDIAGNMTSTTVSASLPFDIRGTGTVTAQIVYTHGQITVSLAQPGGAMQPVLTTTVPDSVRPKSARVGFTGTTAGAVETATVDNFSLAIPDTGIKIDRNKFFALYAKQFGQLKSEYKDSLNTLLGSIERDSDIKDVRWAAYMLATVKTETSDFRPKEESKSLWMQHDKKTKDSQGRSIWDYGHPATSPDGKHQFRYYGRGYVQLTWLDNYRKLGKAIGLGDSLANDPAKALNADIAYRIMSAGMRNGLFRGNYKLSDFINSKQVDYSGARNIINATSSKDPKQDKLLKKVASDTAASAKKFEAILRGSQPGSGFGEVD